MSLVISVTSSASQCFGEEVCGLGTNTGKLIVPVQPRNENVLIIFSGFQPFIALNRYRYIEFRKTHLALFAGIGAQVDISSCGDKIPYFWIYQFLGEDMVATVVAETAEKNQVWRHIPTTENYDNQRTNYIDLKLKSLSFL